MANNKNQHFVPRCHLKPFTLNGEGLSISLFNLPRRRLIRNAPVKNQCSRDYFYGKSNQLEQAIQLMEGTYAFAISQTCERPKALSEFNVRFLAAYWMFQYVRTEAIQGRILKHSENLAAAIGEEFPGLVPSKDEATLLALSVFSGEPDAIADLQLVLVRNRSVTPFVTSDNPAVMTNRHALRISQRRTATYGLTSAGAIALLPVSPEILAMFYDRNVYSVEHDRRVVDIRSELDARALNEHQQLQCVANLYVPPSFSEKHCAALPDLTEQRAESGERVHIFSERRDSVGRSYSMAGPDSDRSGNGFVATTVYYPAPTRWPLFIRWKRGGFYFDNGSAAGPTRQAKIPKRAVTVPFRRVATGF